MGQPWSPAEDAILMEATDWQDCLDRGLTGRTKTQAHNRRERLKSAGHSVTRWPSGAPNTTLPPEPAAPQLPEDEPFGFRDRDEDEDVRDYWEAQKRAIAAHQRRLERRSNRVIPYTTNDPEQPFGIIFFGDTHLGSAGILADRLAQDLDTMREACENLGARLVFMGDAIENAKIYGKAAPAVYDQAIPPANQIDVADLLFRPLAPYFIAFLEGNHDSRDAQQGGVDWLYRFARDIGVPYVSEAGCAIHLTHGFHRAVIYAKHDWRGKSQINKANSLRRFSQEYPEWEGGDVCVLAHLHEPLYESVQQKGRRVHWIRTGSWKVFDSHATKNGYCPELGVAVVIFWPHERRISVSLDLDEGIALLADAQRRYRPPA